jgi:hypothetical protein
LYILPLKTQTKFHNHTHLHEKLKFLYSNCYIFRQTRQEAKGSELNRSERYLNIISSWIEL